MGLEIEEEVGTLETWLFQPPLPAQTTEVAWPPVLILKEATYSLFALGTGGYKGVWPVTGVFLYFLMIRWASFLGHGLLRVSLDEGNHTRDPTATG